MAIKGKKEKGFWDAKAQLMNKRMQKIKDKMDRKKEKQQKEADVKETTPQRRSSIDSKTSIIHKNLFDSSA